MYKLGIHLSSDYIIKLTRSQGSPEVFGFLHRQVGLKPLNLRKRVSSLGLILHR